MGKLQVSLNLSLELLNVSLVLLLPLPAVLNLVKTLLKADLQLVKAIVLVLKELNLLLLLLFAFNNGLLPLIELADQVCDPVLVLLVLLLLEHSRHQVACVSSSWPSWLQREPCWHDPERSPSHCCQPRTSS